MHNYNYSFCHYLGHFSIYCCVDQFYAFINPIAIRRTIFYFLTLFIVYKQYNTKQFYLHILTNEIFYQLSIAE